MKLSNETLEKIVIVLKVVLLLAVLTMFYTQSLEVKRLTKRIEKLEQTNKQLLPLCYKTFLSDGFKRTIYKSC